MPPAKRAKNSGGENKPPGEGPNDDPSNGNRKRKIAEKPESKMQFADMNDDCLLELMNLLPLSDLCSLASTCTRFKRLAQKMFAIKYRTLNFDVLIGDNGRISVPLIQRLLHHFGHLILSLTIDTNRTDDREKLSKLIWLLRKYCIYTLNELVLENQPNERVNEFFSLSMFGTEMILRNKIPGTYGTKRKTIFRPGSSMQIQEIVTDNE